MSVNKGLIQHFVCYNYNITFRKLEIRTVKMTPISVSVSVNILANTNASAHGGLSANVLSEVF